MSQVSVDQDRLWQALMDLAAIGAYDDEATGLRGVHRLALTDADAEGRRHVQRLMTELGLEVRIDQIGNVIGRRHGRDPSQAPVMMGSHIDSVPTGGAFDGALGVLGALEVIRALNQASVLTDRSIEVGFFTDEEGARFGTDMLGSAVAVGRIDLASALALKDAAGKSVGAELQRIGFAGAHPPRLAPPRAYLELHVEQGPILEAAGMELGVVTGIQAISWQELTIRGRAAHAGTTPMGMRKDAGLAAARVNVELDRMAFGGAYGSDLRATMGRIEVHPSRVNVVPERVICTVDLRCPDDAPLARAEADLAQFLDALSLDLGVPIERRQTARTPRISFSTEVQALLAERMTKGGHRFMRLLSGAGHDAQEMSSLCPAAMIFVPGKYDGISHNPREYSTPEACARGAQILLEAVLALAVP